jgi:hypothetical protein
MFWVVLFLLLGLHLVLICAFLLPGCRRSHVLYVKIFSLVDLAEKRVALTGIASRCGANKLARADRIFVGLTSFAV